MTTRAFWVLIETDTDTPDTPDKAEMYRILREAGSYGIVEVADEEEISDILNK